MLWINNLKLFTLMQRLGVADTANNWVKLHKNNNAFFRSIQFFCDRTGLMPPVFNHSIDPDFLLVPTVADTFLSWQQINDQRALQLEKLSGNIDRICIMWSGGIDSTNCLAAVIKNCSRDFLNHVHVVCSDDSLWENPFFYKTQIQPNFPNLVNGVTFNVADSLPQSLIVTGDLADRILGGDLFSLWARQHPGTVKDFRAHKDQIISFFQNILTDLPLSRWFYQTVQDSIDHQGLDIQDIYDFFWWVEFNFTWVGMYYHILKDMPNINPGLMSAYKKNYLMWYNTPDFQSWAVNSIGTDLKYDPSSRMIKRVSKEYIFDLDHNEWYRDYKIKIPSLRKTFENFGHNNLLGITESGNTFEPDLDAITDINELISEIDRLSKD
jgi:hypothetical protein